MTSWNTTLRSKHDDSVNKASFNLSVTSTKRLSSLRLHFGCLVYCAFTSKWFSLYKSHCLYMSIHAQLTSISKYLLLLELLIMICASVPSCYYLRTGFSIRWTVIIHTETCEKRFRMYVRSSNEVDIYTHRPARFKLFWLKSVTTQFVRLHLHMTDPRTCIWWYDQLTTQCLYDTPPPYFPRETRNNSAIGLYPSG